MTLTTLQEIESRSVIPSYARQPVEFVRGERSRLWDVEGNEYLDFLCGISVTSLGHCHPRVVEAVREQAPRLMHTSNLFYTEPAMRLAERLSESSLGGKVYFCNSGAEANEAAIKLARKARSGGDVVVVYGAFHGRTYGALSATPQESKQAPFAPLVPGFRAVAPEPQALRAAVDERTAAVLLEPIQGESGVNVLSDELLASAREACDEYGAALIFDEVQCGMGRTGSLWAYEQTGVVPDAFTAAKALGGGLPIGALITGERLADVFAAGRSRLDLRRWTGDRERRAGGARGDRRPGAAGARARARAAPYRRPRAPAARALGPWPRPDARLRARRTGPGARAARAARAAAGRQRHRADHAAAAAAADHLDEEIDDALERLTASLERSPLAEAGPIATQIGYRMDYELGRRPGAGSTSTRSMRTSSAKRVLLGKGRSLGSSWSSRDRRLHARCGPLSWQRADRLRAERSPTERSSSPTWPDVYVLDAPRSGARVSGELVREIVDGRRRTWAATSAGLLAHR